MEARNQGVEKTKGQLELRRDFLGTIGPRVYGERTFVVFGVVHDEQLEQAATPPDAKGVHAASIRWEEFPACSAHPKGDEFARYLGWKARYSR